MTMENDKDSKDYSNSSLGNWGQVLLETEEMDTLYAAFRIDSECLVEETFSIGFNKGAQMMWDLLKEATSLNIDDFEKTFGAAFEISDILNFSTPKEFIERMNKFKESKNTTM